MGVMFSHGVCLWVSLWLEHAVLGIGLLVLVHRGNALESVPCLSKCAPDSGQRVRGVGIVVVVVEQVFVVGIRPTLDHGVRTIAVVVHAPSLHFLDLGEHVFNVLYHVMYLLISCYTAYNIVGGFEPSEHFINQQTIV
jgi:hypothetical protein